MLQIGQPAPAFRLPDTEKNFHELENFKGKPLVILFFPFAFTGVCTTELCSMRDDIAFYNHLNAQIVAISVDSPFALARFKEEQKLNFPLLSDFNKAAIAAYGCRYESFAAETIGVAKRSAFVVDADGILRYAEVLDNAGQLPNFDAVKATLEALPKA